MAPGNRMSRKRTIEDVNSDPCKFLKAYFKARGIPESPEEDDVLLSGCVERADSARESFKRWRTAAEEPESAGGQPDRALTPKEKYQKRLVNNRRSAAATRVHQEVLRREHTHALRKVVADKVELSECVARLQSTLDQLREENARLTKLKEEEGDKSLDIVVNPENTDMEESEKPSGADNHESNEQDFGNCSLKIDPGISKQNLSKPAIDDVLSNSDTGLDEGSSVSLKSTSSDLIVEKDSDRIASASIGSLHHVGNSSLSGEIAVADPVHGSEPVASASQGDGGCPVAPNDSGAMPSPNIAPQSFPVAISSQLSIGEFSSQQWRCCTGFAPGMTGDEFPDGSQLFCGSQEFRVSASQLFSSQKSS